MSIQIRDITKDNWKAVVNLSVKPQQQNFIESNSYSLAQSAFEPQWKSVALYDDNEVVGYAMHGIDLSNGNVWIDRFMIGDKFQGLGYGNLFIKLLIKNIKEIYNCNKIYLSIYLENQVAKSFYEKYGFKINGEIDSGELVMVLENL